jgi:predicted NUDIX family NTP pyrophosphohydrolase
MPKQSAGVLLFRRKARGLEMLLAHPGGPFWAKKDEGAWSIPKGEISEGEDAEAAARREFFEETGFTPSGELLPLGVFRQPSGKRVAAFALEADAAPAYLHSNACRIEWPPESARFIDIPEVDRLEWFTLDAALVKIAKGQRPILESLAARLGEATLL